MLFKNPREAAMVKGVFLEEAGLSYSRNVGVGSGVSRSTFKVDGLWEQCSEDGLAFLTRGYL